MRVSINVLQNVYIHVTESSPDRFGMTIIRCFRTSCSKAPSSICYLTPRPLDVLTFYPRIAVNLANLNIGRNFKAQIPLLQQTKIQDPPLSR